MNIDEFGNVVFGPYGIHLFSFAFILAISFIFLIISFTSRRRFKKLNLQLPLFLKRSIKCLSLSVFNIDFSDPKKCVKCKIVFTCNLSKQKDDKWIDIVSLKKSDKISSFVFRVHSRQKLFQVYFGDGTSVRGHVKICAERFLNVLSTLKYMKGNDFTYLTLENECLKVVRFVMHKESLPAKIELKYYQEGRLADGVKVHRSEFSNLPVNDVSLSAAEIEFSDDARLVKDADYYDSLRALGSAYFSFNHYEKAYKIFQHLSKSSIIILNHSLSNKVSTCINKVFSVEADRIKAWRGFSNLHHAMFGETRNALLNGNLNESLETFTEAVEAVFSLFPYSYDERKKNHLVFIYKLLIASPDIARISDVLKVNPVNVAIVSGMGWSGSGAIYDYLREFDDVVAVIDETKYIEGRDSLKDIYLALHDDILLKQRVVDFFFYHLIGHCYYRNVSDSKQFIYARRKLASNDCEDYLISVEKWCMIASAMCISFGEVRSMLFRQLASYTVSKFSIGFEIPESKVALLDNVVHIKESAKCIEFLNNTTLFCTFRDPRSNYVALVREADFFKSTIEAYVKERKGRLAKSFQAAEVAKKSAAKEDGKSVEIVRFEEFVFSEKYRESLAKRLGLDLGKRNKHQYFKPWESEKNVFLHESYEKQDEIKAIEDALPEHCIDVHKLKREAQERGDYVSEE